MSWIHNILMNEMMLSSDSFTPKLLRFTDIWRSSSWTSWNFLSISPSLRLEPNNESVSAPPTVTDMMDLISWAVFPSPMIQQDNHSVSHWQSEGYHFKENDTNSEIMNNTDLWIHFSLPWYFVLKKNKMLKLKIKMKITTYWRTRGMYCRRSSHSLLLEQVYTSLEESVVLWGEKVKLGLKHKLQIQCENCIKLKGTDKERKRDMHNRKGAVWPCSTYSVFVAVCLFFRVLSLKIFFHLCWKGRKWKKSKKWAPMNRQKLKKRWEGTGGSGCSITPLEGGGVDEKNEDDEKKEMDGERGGREDTERLLLL